MGWYQRNIFPVMIDRGMRNPTMSAYRPKIIPQASKTVLEIGVGSGLNIPHYKNIDRLYGLEPSKELLEKAEPVAQSASFPVELLKAPAEDIPLEDHSVDTVLSSWTLCSIPEIRTALREMRRVLRPEGQFIFIEHGLAPDLNVRKWQNRLAPIFRTVAGCNLNRKMDDLIVEAGFEFSQLETSYLKGPKFLSYHFIGQAQLTATRN
jgi:ubiquinone/menaquinone biosynthesis C-methylase UbiE